MGRQMDSDSIPAGYRQLPGSEQRAPRGAKLLGPADPRETFKVSIVLHRRTDGEPPPSFEHYAQIRKGERKRMPEEDFSARYGAHPDDITAIERFAEQAGLKVLTTHAARRIVELSGTAEAMGKAFGVTLQSYEHTIEQRVGKQSIQVPEVYRGHEGSVHVPEGIADLIVGVFGLDTRTITKRNANDPPNTVPVSVQQVARIYNFPTNSAAGQTIGIMSPGSPFTGYLQSDLQSSFGASLPVVTPISVDGGANTSRATTTTAAAAMGATSLQLASTAGITANTSYLSIPTLNYFSLITAVAGSTVTLQTALSAAVANNTNVYINLDFETTQDIVISGEAAPGAGVNVFFAPGSQMGWVDLVSRAVTPNAGEPQCSVLSSSFYTYNADDQAGSPSAFLDAVSMAFQDAATHFITVCIASGDTGADSKIGDGKQHVQYPASDPWVLSVGGTTVGNIVTTPPSNDEYVWNDGTGATGGGVSAYFPRPSYQANAGVPVSLRDGTTVGRGVPDVAGNASGFSGYAPIYFAGQAYAGGGTSASAPHWAGLIAVINAALNERVGFINPLLYLFGSSVFRDINPPPGPTNNTYNGVAGYPAGPGWDACTGWGSPNGVALLNRLQPLPAVYITGGYQSPDVILTDLTTNQPVPLGGAPGGPWDTQLQPSTAYGFSAVVHNISPMAANGVKVRFWAIPGGLGTSGTQVGSPVTVNIPAFSSVTVQATANFTSAPAGQHMCAVVSIYDAGTACNVDATTATQIPDPGGAGSHACAAWRNTDSTMVQANSRFRFEVGLGEVAGRLREALALHIRTTHVPARWHELATAREVTDIARFVGAEPRIPLYLVPHVQHRLAHIDVEPHVKPLRGGEVKHVGGQVWKLHPQGTETAPVVEVSGKLPDNVAKGDVVLVKLSADWPATEDRAARTVEFLEFVHVQ